MKSQAKATVQVEQMLIELPLLATRVKSKFLVEARYPLVQQTIPNFTPAHLHKNNACAQPACYYCASYGVDTYSAEI